MPNAQRRRVYPRLVSEGRMSQRFADTQTATMEATVERLRELAESE